ncbi:choline/ethanolamine kinase [Colletotrichum higginsianum]|uniref:ethanolamine kinase n=2 Tax=Colletotrichum higginsianum TaxID=80884 RepID=H1VRD8_COLHI|nr:Choline/ethanolamine kinase [Colletotrichum higginsianum IMI 349063]OBR05130.1 Choline/ethanolamine kinase [Colletotrichum higginsianum IMI 349063]TIC94246.1 putative ethanolamine kinase [Colletotrichum higginsianum]CCF42794.1 choline/ethanolamine kinase [Colletotrichum higginsianum]
MTQGANNGHLNGLALPHVRILPLSYDSEDSQQSATRLILTVRPDWASDDSNIEFIRFTDGITNTLLKAINKRKGWSKEDIDREAILLRAYGNGTAVLIDREREAQNHELLMKYGLAPELLARFQNGMIYRFIKGSVTSPEDLRKPAIYRAVASRLAQWHATVPCITHPTSANSHVDENGANGDQDPDAIIENAAPGKPVPNLWTVMQKWILALPINTQVQRERQEKLQRELEYIVKEFSQRPGLGADGLVFAHCDLLSGNVIVLPSSLPAKGSKKEATVTFIDYEYATPSPAAFDIANHFAEWGGFDCDYNVLPTKSQRREFIEEYVRSYFRCSQGNTGVDIEAETRKLNDEVDLFRGVPGFYWGIWALIQAVISEIDFDYASYAETRLSEYWAWKEEKEGDRAAAGKEMPLRERRWEQME